MVNSNEQVANGLPAFGRPPVARFKLTWEYMKVANRRLERARSGSWIFTHPIGAIMGVVILALSGFALVRGDYWTSFLQFGFAVIAILVINLKILLWWEFRRIPLRDQEVVIEFDIEGLRFRSSIENSLLRWNGILRVIRFPDGYAILFFDSTGHWLPHSGFASRDDSEAAHQILESKVENFQQFISL